MRRAVTATVTAAGTVAGLILTATPGQASHTVWVKHGYDVAGYHHLSGAKDYVEVCDRERDGNRVYAHLYFGTGGGYVYDKNGSKYPCTTKTVEGAWEIRICEERWGPDRCSRWKEII